MCHLRSVNVRKTKTLRYKQLFSFCIIKCYLSLSISAFGGWLQISSILSICEPTAAALDNTPLTQPLCG